MEGEKRRERRPGAGRPKKYTTEAARLEGLRARQRKYQHKLQAQRVRVVSYLSKELVNRLDSIGEREGLPSRAEALRWLIENDKKNQRAV